MLDLPGPFHLVEIAIKHGQPRLGIRKPRVFNHMLKTNRTIVEYVTHINMQVAQARFLISDIWRPSLGWIFCVESNSEVNKYQNIHPEKTIEETRDKHRG